MRFHSVLELANQLAQLTNKSGFKMIDNVISSIGTCIFKILTCYKLPNQHLLVRTLLLDPEMTDNNLF